MLSQKIKKQNTQKVPAKNLSTTVLCRSCASFQRIFFFFKGSIDPLQLTKGYGGTHLDSFDANK